MAERSFIEVVTDAMGHGDLLEVFTYYAGDAAGSDFGDADNMFSITDGILGGIETLIAQIGEMKASGLLDQAGKELGSLNAIHTASQAVQHLQDYLAFVETARNAGELEGGLALVGNTAGDASHLLSSASGALAVIGSFVPPPGNAAILIASASLGTLGATLEVIQNAAQGFDDFVNALETAMDRASDTGAPVTFDPAEYTGGDNSSPPGSPGNSGIGDPGDLPGDPGRVRTPLVITRDDTWEDLVVPEDIQAPFVVAPPEEVSPPSDDSPGDDGGGGGGNPPRRFPDLEELYGNRPAYNPGFGPGLPEDEDTIIRDPLILDLDGDGVELTQIGDPVVYFDANGDGVASLTGWVNPDDGFLGRDVDGSGLIETQAELFGNSTTDAISDLAAQDDNADGVINSDDSIWDSLRIWRDLNQDGTSSANELQTMDEAGMLSFSLDAQSTQIQRGDNLVHSTTTYETTAGRVGRAEAVFFGVDSFFSQSTPSVAIEAGSPLLDIPNVKGFGNLADLRIAAANDPELLALVQSLVSAVGTQSGAEFQVQFESMVLRWAGVEDVDPGADPATPNQQHEAFLTAFRGVEQIDVSGSRALAGAENGYYSAVDSLMLRFGIGWVATNAAAADTPEEINLVLQTPFFGLSLATVDPVFGIVNGGLERVISEVASRLSDDLGTAFAQLDQVMPFLSAYRHEYFAEDGERLDFTLVNEDFNAFVQAAFSEHLDHPALVEFAFAALNSSSRFNGTSGNDVATVSIAAHVTQFARDTLINLAGGDDLVTVTLDEETSAPWSVSYLYRDGDGTDRIDVSGAPGAHRLFLTDIPSGQVSVRTLDNGLDTVVEFSNGNSITFLGLTAGTGSLDVIAADGEIIVLGSADQGGVFIGTAADEDHVGNPDLEDNYFYQTGGGADSITEDYTNNDDAQDRLTFGDINRSDLGFSVDGNDLILTFTNGQPGDSIRLVNQTATHGFGSLNTAFKVEEFQFANGEVISAQQLIDDYLTSLATDGDDVITGFRFADTIQLSNGTDSVHGGRADDTYIRGADVTGITTIEDNGPSGGDTLIIQGFSQAEASFTRDGNHVTITLPNGSVVLRNQMSTNVGDTIETIQFSDGAMTALQLTAELLPSTGSFVDLVGTEGAETLQGGADNERIDGLGGDDVLNGRSGSDIYVFGDASGNDTIDESGTVGSSSVDRLQLLDVNVGDVSLTRVGVDLIIEVVSTGQTLEIDQQFTSENVGIEFFEFADGTIWDREMIAQNSFVYGTDLNDTISGSNASENIVGQAGDDELRGNRGDDIYIFSQGDGHDQIIDARYGNVETVVNTVRLLDTTLADLRVELVNDGGSISDIRLIYGPDDSVLLDGAASTSDFVNSRPIQRVELSDGTVLTDEELLEMAVIYGTEGDDVISGAIRVDGLGGDDVITGFGSETDFIWRAGSGNDLIINRGFDGGTGQLVLEGLSLAEVSLSRSGLDLVVTNLATNETVTVQNQFQPVQSGRKPGLNGFVFEDATLDRDAVANASLTTATVGDDQIIGGYDNEVFEGLAGHDTLDGGQGSDAYVWSKGDGNDWIRDDSRGFETIDALFLVDVNRSGVTLSRVDGTSSDLLITITETGETISVSNQLGYANDGLEWIQFADGSRMSLAGIESDIAFVDVNRIGLVEGDYLDNRLQGLAGDDLLNGMEGRDTYLWSQGDGNDTIAETGIDYIYDEEGGDGDGEGSVIEVEVPIESPGDVLHLIGVRQEQVSLTRPDGSDDLLVTMAVTGEVITVVDHFVSDLAGIERIRFSDGVFGRADILNSLPGETLVGDGSDQTLVGGPGADIFTLSGGDEAVQTGGGRDTVIIGANGGVDRIEGFDRGIDGTTVVFTDAPFVDFDALIGASVQTSDGVTIDLGGGHSLELVGVLLSDLEPDSFGFSRPAIMGTDGDDALFGTDLDDQIILLDGDDLVRGEAGDDSIDGGEGFDVVYFSGQSEDYEITEVHGQTVVRDLNLDDGDDGTDTLTNAEVIGFLGDQVTVSLAGNTAPVAASEGNAASGTEDVVLTGAIPAATDADGDTPLEYRAVGAAVPGLTLNLDGSFTFAPAVDFNGDVAFDYVVSDPAGDESAPTRFTIDIAAVNDAPTLRANLADRGSAEDEEVSFQLPVDAFEDVDGDDLTLAASLADGTALPGWLSFDADSRSFSGTPPADFHGDLVLQVTASDGELSVSDDFTLQITPVNDAPILVNPLQDQTGEEDALVSFQLPVDAFTDVDGDDLALSASLADGTALPEWLAFDANSRSFSGTPPVGSGGLMDLRVTASDGELLASDDFLLDISAGGNQGPVGTDDGIYDVEFGNNFRIEAAELLANDTDADGDALSITSVHSAQNGSVWLASGSVNFRATPDHIGEAGFSYTLSDGTEVDVATVSLNVLSPYAEFEQGTEGSDRMIGEWRAPNLLFGASGNDVLRGGREDDQLAGGEGNDRLYGWSGNDVLEGGTGLDRLFGGRGNDVLDGGAGNDKLFGQRGNDRMRGGDGNDRMYGGSGNDTMNGDNGNDRMYGGSGRNVLTGGDGNDRMWGGTSVDRLYGGTGDDVLFGLSGNDHLGGGLGDDRLYGGWGQDTFVFATGDGADRIMDFQATDDTWWRSREGDTIQIRVDGIESFSDLRSTIRISGEDVEFRFSRDDVLTLENTQYRDLLAEDFIFL